MAHRLADPNVASPAAMVSSKLIPIAASCVCEYGLFMKGMMPVL
jgi:hypothetical protein